MENIDREKALRVWQRVQSAPEAQDLGYLAEEALTDGAVLLRLSRRFQGQWRKRLWDMSRQEQHQGMVLKGIIAVTRGSSPGIRAERVNLVRTESLLRRCWQRMERRSRIYGTMAADPEFGRIYADFAAREDAHCRQLLLLLGTIRGSDIPRRNGQP